jgi:hypothetical protein
MLRGRQVQNAAFRCGLAIGLFAISIGDGLAEMQDRNGEKYAVADSGKCQQQRFDFPLTWALCPSRPEPINEAQADWRNPNCSNPNSHDEADLCIQREIAAYTNRSIDLGWAQFLFSALGFIALLITIYLTYRATNAAERAVAVAEDTAKRELRAYVHVCEAKITNANSDEWGPTISVGIQNFGQTPAYAVVHKFNYLFQMAGTPNFEKAILAKHNSGDIGHGQILFQSTLIPFAKWNRHKPMIIAGNNKFFVFGEITYFDAFEKTITRTTKYRFEIVVDDEGISDGNLAVCHDGNSAT